ncbi:MAG: 2-(1,2-epoxy-1,2-dihydrophenyl)acetyl-CoA isomerase PaaG [Alphaproteobacteria bacterium]
MKYERIVFDLRDAVARITFNRPDRLNSFTVEMHEEVAHAIGETSRSARVLVITGAGRGFCAGQDLSDPAVKPGSDLREMLEMHYNPLVRSIASLEMPVIAAVNGVAAGAGANIALACDIVIAARSARFIQSFSNIGLIPDAGGTWNLPRLCGQARAMGLALTGEPLSAERAEGIGMIWKCVDDDKLHVEVDALAAKFASAPTRGLALTKKLMRDSVARSLQAQLDAECEAQSALGRSLDYQEGLAAFMEKRSPVFKGA